jgi:capsular exopolysaccharide synthesis family protein
MVDGAALDWPHLAETWPQKATQLIESGPTDASSPAPGAASSEVVSSRRTSRTPMLLSSILDRREDSETVADPIAKDPIEKQILVAGNLSEAQVEAIRGFQRRKGLTFAQAAITLGLVRRESLLLALSKHYNYPVLGFGSADARISRELVAGYQPFSAAAEAYRSVRSALVTGSLSQGKNAFAVIGARSRVGVTSFAANLALSFAQMAVPTLLVDANLRRPRLTGLFGLDKETEGLVEALTLRATGSSSSMIVDVLPCLSLFVAGATAPHPQELLISKEFLTLSQNAQRNFGVVIYDTPPALESADAYVVASRVGSAILVARRHRTTVKDIENIAHTLTGNQCEIAGTVLGFH